MDAEWLTRHGYTQCGCGAWVPSGRKCRCGNSVTPDDVFGPAETGKAPKGPNKTEARYNAEKLAGAGRYEALTFRLANGHRYTPDWVIVNDGWIECHEVKGSHRFHSHQRARLAFDQARVEWPGIVFVWATLQKGGTWKVER